uniref:Protein kinase domain-containing protein n=1 Tax=Globodera rostochiensis TaxID=31243 RepID=A0A914I1Y6_GLORO
MIVSTSKSFDMIDWRNIMLCLKQGLENTCPASIVFADVNIWKEREWTGNSGNLFIKALTRPISVEEDSKIYFGCVLDFPNHYEKLGYKKRVAIKVVMFRGNDYYKSENMMKHEVDILKLSTQRSAKYVVKLIDSLTLPNSLVMVMELGDQSLNHQLKLFKAEWKQHEDLETINFDIKSILLQMVVALQDLHRFAVHLALKSENWLYVFRDGKQLLVLIDFQTSILVQMDGRVDSSTEHKQSQLRAFMCKTKTGRTNLPRSQRFASPEHRKFCENPAENEITVQTDIWSLGILLLEILAKTPQIDAICRTHKRHRVCKQNNDRQNFKILRNAFVDDELVAVVPGGDENDQNIDDQLKTAVSIYFPHLYVLIEQMLSNDPESRPTTQMLLNELQK